MPSKQKSPPPYYPDSRHHGSRDLYGERVSTRPSYSHYPNEDLPQFYKWTSPPGVIKIVSIIIVILCVAIFACVASTLAWDIDMELSGFGGMGSGLAGGSYGGGYGSMGGGYGSMGGGFGSMGGGGYGGSGGGYGYGGIGGNYADPKAGKGFIIAISALTFITVLVIFILVISRQNSSRSRKFYLAVIIIGAILAIFMFISTIVYLVAINPTAQTSGSVFYNQIIALCSQYQNPQPSGIFINQYLYHYCVVEPQEAIAVVFGVLVTIGLIIIAVFAAKTRQQIQRYGEPNIVWEGVKVVSDGLPHDTGAWVNSTSGEPERMLNAYPDKFRGSRSLLEDSSAEYVKQLHSPTKLPPATYSSDSEIPSSVWKPEKRVSKLLHPNSQDMGAESGEDLDETDFDSEFPAITNEQKRQEYKKEFDRNHKEYKILQAELDDINKGLSEMDRELSRLPQGSSKYLDTMVEYNRLKNIKKSADYQMKKQRSKYLKAKLSHIKKMVSDHDRRR